MTGEARLIERIRRRITPPPGVAHSRGLLLGIGDDAAVLRPARGVEWILTCDSFLENVHFLADVHPPQAVGYKALARASSDVVAMGGVPRFFLLGLALPRDRARKWLDGFVSGVARAARRFGVMAAGGDTARHATVAIHLTVLGEVPVGGAVARSGARAGDLIYVSGRLGAAQLGLELILRGLHRQRRWQGLLRAHLYPELHMGLGQWLARRRLASAMIDVSDGLSSDLQHLCQSSAVGARLWADRIPCVKVPAALQARALDPLALALHGGEDYELLFTVPRRLAAQIPEAHHGTPVRAIGEIVRGRTMYLVGRDGRATVLEARGWDPFRSKQR